MMQRPWRLAVLVFVLAFVFRLAVAWRTGLFQVVSGTEQDHIALSIARTGQYGNPYSLYTGSTAHEMPVYTYYLAALYALFGTGLLTEAVRVTITCAVSALRCALIPLLACDAGLGSLATGVAGIVSAFYIPALQTDVMGGTDGAWVSLVVLAIVWISLRVWRSSSWRSSTPWWFFVLCGAAALLDPVVLPVIAAFLIAGAIACPPGSFKRYARQAILLVVTVFVFLAPWAMRNYFVLNKLIWTKSNFGLEFWMSNGPSRAFDLATNMGDPNLHPSNSYVEAQRVAALGEVEYNRQKLAEAATWVRENPGDFLRLTLRRLVAWWFPPAPNIAIQVAKLILSLLAFAGLVLLLSRWPLIGWLFLLTWIALPDIYYVIQWSSRYRFPMEWELVISASVTLASAYGALQNFLRKERT